MEARRGGGATAAGAGVEDVITRQELPELLARQSPDPSARATLGPEDIAHLVYTSGTTDNPKGAMILHRNVAFNAEVYPAENHCVLPGADRGV